MDYWEGKMKIFNKIFNFLFGIFFILLFFHEILGKQNIAAGLFFSICLVISYDMWKRGNTDSKIFGDMTKIEKDLRKIQELEIKQKLKELGGEND
jgi:hypothetical protein